jgi:hypothetical protein
MRNDFLPQVQPPSLAIERLRARPARFALMKIIKTPGFPASSVIVFRLLACIPKGRRMVRIQLRNDDEVGQLTFKVEGTSVRFDEAVVADFIAVDIVEIHFGVYVVICKLASKEADAAFGVVKLVTSAGRAYDDGVVREVSLDEVGGGKSECG